MLHINRGFTIMKQIMKCQAVSNIPVKAIKQTYLSTNHDKLCWQKHRRIPIHKTFGYEVELHSLIAFLTNFFSNKMHS